MKKSAVISLSIVAVVLACGGATAATLIARHNDNLNNPVASYSVDSKVAANSSEGGSSASSSASTPASSTQSSLSQELVVTDSGVYGIERDQGAYTFHRTDDAVGLQAGINGAQNDFDTRGPWALMKYQSVNGNYVVSVPKYYTNETGTKVSLVKQDDTWHVPAAFLNADGTEKDWFHYGAYPMSLDSSGKAQSMTNVMPRSTITFDQFRTAAAAAGGHVSTYAEYSSIIQLMSIELGTTHIDDTLEGIRSQVKITVNKSIQENVANVLYVDDVGDFVEGMPFEILDQNNLAIGWGTIAAVDDESTKKSIAFSDTTINMATLISSEASKGHTGDISFRSMGYPNGYLHYHGRGSIRTTDAINPKNETLTKAFSYRGIENPYGQYVQWVDGIASKKVAGGNVELLTCKDLTKLSNANASATNAVGYETIATIESGNLNAWKYVTQWDVNADGYFYPNAIGSSPVYGKGGLYVANGDGYFAFFVGANFGNESNPGSGPFLLVGNYRSSYGDAGRGARLSF